MADRRALFDFAVTFSNGGGLQGQGFKLDIDGDDIEDDALAAHIVADLRLLMVDEVHILAKTIVAERHKRPAVPAAGEAAGGSRIVDLSHTVADGTVTYRGLPAPVITDHLTREASRDVYEPGTEFQIGRIEMVSNTGTYIDTPFHRFDGGYDLAGLDASRAADLPGTVVRVTGAAGRAIGWEHFAAVPVMGRAVLVETGWSRHWGTEGYFDGHPHLTADAAAYLRDHGAALVGIDSLNIDDTSTGARPVHTTLLEAGIPVVEHLAGLDALPAEGFRFTALPPKVAGMGTFPVRAFAVLGTAPTEQLVPVLRVFDADAAVAWYRRLRFEHVGTHRFEPGLPRYVFLRRGDIHLHLSEHAGDAPPHGLVYFYVDDVDAVAAEFGVTPETKPWQMREIGLTDPAGNRVRIGSPADPTA